MRAPEEVERVLALIEQGLNNCEIARATGISVTTIRWWRSGRVPRRDPVTGNAFRAGTTCPVCTDSLETLDLRAYSYLLGLYLGDGYIAACRKSVYRLDVALDRRYRGIVHECINAMGLVMPTNKVGIREARKPEYPDGGADIVYSHSKHWPCLFPQHGPGLKHERRIALEEWQSQIADTHPRELLRGLIHSDGWRGTNRVTVRGRTYAYPRYLFSNRSEDIMGIFTRACDLLGIAWRKNNWHSISVAKRCAVTTMDAFIGPKR